MEVRNPLPPSLAASGAIVSLCLLICLAANTKVQAQNKPPILSDDDISAFNKQAIERLQVTAGDVTNPASAKLARNKLIAIAVEQVDTAFNDFRKKSRKRTDTLSFLFDFLEIGASSAISIVKGERPKSLIGEALSLFQGSRSAFNKDFRFLERQILFDKMVALRSDRLTAIYNKMDEEVLEYPWEQSRSELRDYFFAGTIDEALSGLSRDTGAQAKTAEAALKTAKEQAGIKGAVSKMALAAHNAFGAVLEPITRKNTDADNAIFKADADIAKAQRQIDDENLKPSANRVQATIDAGILARTNAEKEKKDAQDEQAKLLEKMKLVFSKVADNPILAPLLPTLSTGNGIQPAQKQRIEDSLNAARGNTATFQDYQRVLGNLRRVVVDMVDKDPRPSDEFQKILVANQ
jgi:hypothetical protein